jgi:small G protein signaling modulator 3
MASASSSTPQPAIPVNSHPLLADDLPSRGRRTRDVSRKEHGDPTPADSNNTRTPNYFTLKERLDTKARASPSNGRANWDGSVRGYGKADRPHTTRDTSSTRQPLPTTWDRSPTFVVGSSKDHLSAGSTTRTAELVAIDGIPSGAASRILSNPWHDYSDEAIQSAISSISVTESPASVSSHPYHSSLRVLSSAVHNLTKIRREMGESLRVIQEKERARKQRAEELMKELQPSERDIARRVMQSLFTDDDEGMHNVERSQSQMVSSPSI